MRRTAYILVLLVSGSVCAAAADEFLLLQISDKAPPCEDRVELPIVPNDPAAITTPGGGRRCYGTHPSVLEVSMPPDRLVWFDRSAGHPAVWVAVGPTLVDAQAVSEAPLGMRLTAPEAGQFNLQTYYQDWSTLTPIRADVWQRVRTADGATLWARVRTAATNP